MKTIVTSIFSLLLSLAMIIPGTVPVLAADDQNTNSTASGRASLMIKAPNAADVGQQVTITVFSKNQRNPVEKAGVYALKIGELPVTSNTSAYDAVIAEYTTLAKGKGTFLGNTDDSGNVICKFPATNRYLLIAVKDGFFPGFSRISITLAAKKGLNIKSPNGAEAGSPVTFIVTERFTNQQVANAAIYAKVIREIAVPTISPAVKVVPPPSTSNVAPPTITSSSSQGTTMITTAKPVEAVPKPVIASAISSIAPIIKANAADFEADKKTAEDVQRTGILLGNTNDKGELTYAFKGDGIYLLAAIKADYGPGFAKIAITLAGQKKLGMKAPGNAVVNTPVSMFVLERPEGKPAANAKVFALKITDQVLSANRPFETIYKDEKISVYMGEKYASLIKEKGLFIGETSADGQISYAFTEQGWYVLVAAKDGYLPVFHRIDILLAGQKGLDIKAPGSSPIGQPVTITVFDRQSQNVVEKASVFAVKVNLITVPPVTGDGTATQKIIPGDPSNPTEAEQYLAIAKQKGIFLGETGKSGTVVYTFTEGSLYILVAVKENYAPAFARINIGVPAVKILNINAPEVAEVNQQFTIKVVEMASQGPVPKADVFAVKVSDIPVTATAADLLNNKAVAVTPLDINDIKAKGIYLGSTDDNGAVTAKLAASARYRLAAIKSDYLPGFDIISIAFSANKVQ